MGKIKFNKLVKIILSDVDETIADLYLPADPAMAKELSELLLENKIIFFITGQSITSVMWRITDQIPAYLRKNILVGHCSGAEVWGFGDSGERLGQPFYSTYEAALNEIQRKKWREVMKHVIDQYKLIIYPTMPVADFIAKSAKNPLAVMMEDRGPQITFEFVNGYDVSPTELKNLGLNLEDSRGTYDLRIPVLETADVLLKSHNIPVSPRLGGVFALDFAVMDVSKTTAVRHVLEDYNVLTHIGLSRADLTNPNYMEIWGDKFSLTNGGTDRHMCEAVSPDVRAIDFRHENPEEFPPGFNIVLWDGLYDLQQGTLEYLKSR